MKTLFITLLFFLSFSLMAQDNIYDFNVVDISGNEFKFESLKGNKILIVNTASKCSLTPQYKGLEKLYKEYMNQNFVIIGFPANNFRKKEPGSNEEIAEFCEKNYGVSFPMMSKISVKGEDIHPLYKWLTLKELNGVMDIEVRWNFQKFMIDEKGELADVAFPREKPYSSKIVNWLAEQ
ncbi:MAG: glutathione peroxidase [Bacteroidales bacterium]|nr:glutathione peroxidase [Bacteroidales bacterium]